MTSLFREEIKQLYSFLKRNYGETVVIGSAVLFLLLNEYHPIDPQWFGSLIYYVFLPVLTIVILLRRNPLDFGFRIGNYRIWGFHVVMVFLIGLPVLYLTSHISSLEAYYTMPSLDLPEYCLETLAYLFAWEFLFRGFLLFGLKERFKEGSIIIQMIPFVLLHFGKPEIETISTVLTGIYFGYVVYRGNSYWPALIIHLFINISFRVFVNLL